MTTNEELTWEDLADLYGKRTGGRARIMSMDDIYNWAVSQPDIEKTADGGLIIKETADEMTR
jgi:hypothetical protein